MIIDLIVALIGQPPEGLYWLVYIVACYIVIALITISCNLISSIFKFPFKRRF